MARENGQLRTCDKCGRTIFLKSTGEGEMDGGFTRWNKFEDADGWHWREGFKDLCPDCIKKYDELYNEFLDKFKTN